MSATDDWTDHLGKPPVPLPPTDAEIEALLRHRPISPGYWPGPAHSTP